MKLNNWAVVAGLGLALSLGANNSLAQQDNGGGGGRQRGGGGFGGGGNFDPAQMRERMLDDMRDQLEVKEDAEWKAIQPLIEKVMDAQRQVMSERIRGFFGGRGGGRNGGDNNGGGDNGGGRRRGGPFGGGEPSPEAEALQKAIDSKATGAELKAALAKFQDARKAKQADLEKAQGDLRKVLSSRQEAILSLRGLL